MKPFSETRGPHSPQETLTPDEELKTKIEERAADLLTQWRELYEDHISRLKEQGFETSLTPEDMAWAEATKLISSEKDGLQVMNPDALIPVVDIYNPLPTTEAGLEQYISDKNEARDNRQPPAGFNSPAVTPWVRGENVVFIPKHSPTARTIQADAYDLYVYRPEEDFVPQEK